MYSKNDYDTYNPSIGIKLRDFEILSELGRGAYGVVSKVKSHIDKNLYVVKMMDLKHMKEKQQKECWKEATILKKLNHPNIIKYYSSFLEDDKLYIVMEYAEGGDLYSLIKQNNKNNKIFSEDELWRFTHDILMGVEYLHENKIIHRDIKCLNLFMTKERRIKIGDLGVSKIVSSMDALQCTRVGTPLYLSPEQIKQAPYDYKVDMWSVGCSLYHLACLDPPFKGENLIILGNNILKTKQKPISNLYSRNMSELIEKLLSKRSDNRPNAREALLSVPRYIIDQLQSSKDKLLRSLRETERNSFDEEVLEMVPKIVKTSVNHEHNKFNQQVKETNKIKMDENKKVTIPHKSENFNNLMSPSENKVIKKEGYINDQAVSELNFNTNTNNANLFLKQNKLNTTKNPSKKVFNREDNCSKVVNHNFNIPVTKLANDYNSNINPEKNEIKLLNIREKNSNKNLYTKEIEEFNNNKITSSARLSNINIDSGINDEQNFIQNVENFFINTGTKVKENDNSKVINPIINRPTEKTEKTDSPILAKIQESNEENQILIDHKNLLINNATNYKTNQDDYFANKRLLSSKLKAPVKFRPNTASNNKILLGNNNQANFNFNIKEEKDASSKLNCMMNNKFNINNRPFTAVNKGEKCQAQRNDSSENKNVINININFYNIDMNKKFINPSVQSSLIHINHSLFGSKDKKENPPQSENNKEQRRNKSTNPNTIKNNLNTNSQQLVFHKILKSIESQLG